MQKGDQAVDPLGDDTSAMGPHDHNRELTCATRREVHGSFYPLQLLIVP